MHNFYSFFIEFDGQQTLSAFLILFAVIDILGNTGIIISLRRQVGSIHAEKTTVVMGMIMVSFLFLGPTILSIFQVDIGSFAIAGGVILFLLGLEMVLSVNIFKVESCPETASVVPLAFPILAGAGTLTALLTLKAEYKDINILCGTLANLILVYIFLRCSEWIEYRLGKLGVSIVHKVMGIILLSIAVKLFKTHLLLPV
ncbi:MAG: MarC family protein [Bacteroidota bacterium]